MFADSFTHLVPPPTPHHGRSTCPLTYAYNCSKLFQTYHSILMGGLKLSYDFCKFTRIFSFTLALNSNFSLHSCRALTSYGLVSFLDPVPTQKRNPVRFSTLPQTSH